MIHVDWKATGDDLLILFRENYPEESCFLSTEFETLCDDLTNEPVEQCILPLASFLHAHKRYLLKLSTDSDTYMLLVSSTNDPQANDALVRAKIEAFYKTEAETISPTFELMEVKKNPRRKKDFTPSASQKKSFSWIEDSFDYGEHSGGLFTTHGQHIVPLPRLDSANNQESYFSFDYSQWPPTEADLFANYSDTVPIEQLQFVGFLSGSPLYIRTEPDKSKPRKSHAKIRTLGITLHGKWQLLGGNTLLLGESDTLTILGDSVMLTRSMPAQCSVIHTRLDSSHTETLYMCDAGHQLHSFSLDQGHLLLVKTKLNAPSSCFYSVLDKQTGHFIVRDQHLPFPPFSLGSGYCSVTPGEFLYFYAEKKLHSESFAYQESFLWACRINYLNGTFRTSRLEGFEGVQQINASLLRDQPKHIITYHSIAGYITTFKGHEGWWIWNLLSDAFGTVTRFWLWNKDTNTVIKVTNRDFKTDPDQVVYSPSLDRYLCLSDGHAHLLAPFDEIEKVFNKNDLIIWSDEKPLVP